MSEKEKSEEETWIRDKLKEEYLKKLIVEYGEKIIDFKAGDVVLPDGRREKTVDVLLGIIGKLLNAVADAKIDSWLKENMKEEEGKV
jgi:hypothetical protein